MINGSTGIAGVFGDPIAHSLSPAIHNKAFNILGMNAVYVAFHVTPQNLPEAVAGIRGLDLLGINVTIPHKQAVMEHLDHISEESAAIGAVNTIRNENGVLTGYTTDATGFIRSSEQADIPMKDKRVVILGGGGTARSIAMGLALQRLPAELVLLGRTVSKVEKIAADIKNISAIPVTAAPLNDWLAAGNLAGYDYLANCTSVGMHPLTDASPVPAGLLHSGLVVHDVVYNPITTKLLADAEKAGCTCIDGLGMLIHQGIASFEIWTGQTPPADRLRETALSQLKQQ